MAVTRGLGSHPVVRGFPGKVCCSLVHFANFSTSAAPCCICTCVARMPAAMPAPSCPHRHLLHMRSLVDTSLCAADAQEASCTCCARRAMHGWRAERAADRAQRSDSEREQRRRPQGAAAVRLSYLSDGGLRRCGQQWHVGAANERQAAVQPHRWPPCAFSLRPRT